MTTLVFPDAMPDFKYWLKNDPILQPMHGGRVFFRLPRTTKAPMLRISQVGGGQQVDSEVPLQDIRLVTEIWGMQDSDYQAVRQLRLALEHVCHQWVPGTLLNPSSNTIMWNARWETSFDSPDDETGWPRMICTTLMTVIAQSPTSI